jgi:hypothetical protein
MGLRVAVAPLLFIAATATQNFDRNLAYHSPFDGDVRVSNTIFIVGRSGRLTLTFSYLITPEAWNAGASNLRWHGVKLLMLPSSRTNRFLDFISLTSAMYVKEWSSSSYQAYDSIQRYRLCGVEV